jgi:hypothetical protein
VRREAVGSAKVPPVARISAVVALLIALALVWQGLGLLQRDLAFTAAETEVSFWGRGEYQPYEDTRETVGRAVEQLVAAAPGQPDYLTLAASYYAWRGYWAQEATVETEYNALALAAQYSAQQSRPAYRQGWESMLRYAALVDETGAQLKLAQRRLDALQPRIER